MVSKRKKENSPTKHVTEKKKKRFQVLENGNKK